MSLHLTKEAESLRSALMSTPLGAKFDELYAAQQAIAYASNPHMFEPPSKMVERFNTMEGLKDYPSESDPALCE